MLKLQLKLILGTVNKLKLEKYKSAGINRVSVGLQSSNDLLLKNLGRIHKYIDFEKTINLLKKVGFENINADIIIGIPGQTIYDVEDTLNKILSLDLTHVSMYSLIYEEGTMMTKLLENGKIDEVDEEIERYMYWYVKHRLQDNRIYTL